MQQTTQAQCWIGLILLTVIVLPAAAQPAPPGLVGPPHMATVTGHSQRFDWTLVSGATYRLCISPPGVGCGTPGSMVWDGLGQTHYAPAIPNWLFEDSDTLNWSVAACIAGNCSAFQPQYRSIVISGRPDAPNLTAPDDPYAVVNPAADVFFSWGVTLLADTYKLCISRPGIGCGTGDSFVVSHGGLTNVSAQVPARFHTEPFVHWTVAACNDAGCTYQQNVRTLILQAVHVDEPEDGADDMGTEEMESSATSIGSGGDIRIGSGTDRLDGCPFPDDADYGISPEVILEGPEIIGGSSAVYTVTFQINRQSSVGSAAPVVVLVDFDLLFFRGNFDLMSWTQIQMPDTPGWHTGTARLTLQCIEGEVHGTAVRNVRGGSNDPNSGEGSNTSGIGLFLDDADIIAKVSWCRNAGDGANPRHAPSSEQITVHCGN